MAIYFQKRKPFHEVVIDIINGCSSTELSTIGNFLLGTTIPKSHSKIANAWRSRCERSSFDQFDTNLVANSIVEHGAELRRTKSEAKKKEVPNRIDSKDDVGCLFSKG